MYHRANRASTSSTSSTRSTLRQQEIFHQLMLSTNNLQKNWKVDIANLLDDYMAELELGQTSDEDIIHLNFGEAALVLQNSAVIYTKKVQCLEKCVTDMYKSLSYEFQLRKKEREKRKAEEEEAREQIKKQKVEEQNINHEQMNVVIEEAVPSTSKQKTKELKPETPKNDPKNKMLLLEPKVVLTPLPEVVQQNDNPNTVYEFLTDLFKKISSNIIDRNSDENFYSKLPLFSNGIDQHLKEKCFKLLANCLSDVKKPLLQCLKEFLTTDEELNIQNNILSEFESKKFLAAKMMLLTKIRNTVSFQNMEDAPAKILEYLNKYMNSNEGNRLKSLNGASILDTPRSVFSSHECLDSDCNHDTATCEITKQTKMVYIGAVTESEHLQDVLNITVESELSLISSEHPENASEHPSDSNEHLQDASEQPQNSEGHPSGSNEHSLNTSEHSPNTSEHPPNTSEHPLNTSEHSPNTSEHPPNTSEHSPNTSEHPPDTSEHPPNTSEHSPDTSEHPPNSGEQPQTASEHLQIANEHSPNSSEHLQNSGEHSSNANEPITSENPLNSSEQLPDIGENPPNASEQLPTVIDSNGENQNENMANGNACDRVYLDSCFLTPPRELHVALPRLPLSELNNCSTPLDRNSENNDFLRKSGSLKFNIFKFPERILFKSSLFKLSSDIIVEEKLKRKAITEKKCCRKRLKFEENFKSVTCSLTDFENFFCEQTSGTTKQESRDESTSITDIRQSEEMSSDDGVLRSETIDSSQGQLELSEVEPLDFSTIEEDDELFGDNIIEVIVSNEGEILSLSTLDKIDSQSESGIGSMRTSQSEYALSELADYDLDFSSRQNESINDDGRSSCPPPLTPNSTLNNLDYDIHSDNMFDTDFETSSPDIGSTLEGDFLNKIAEELKKQKEKEKEQLEIQKRVEEWHKTIEPQLKDAELRSHFDIHEYGKRILETCPDTESTVGFEDIVVGQPRKEIARYFLASLQLANDYNVEIIHTDPNPLAVNCMELRKLSTAQYDKIRIDFNSSKDPFSERNKAESHSYIQVRPLTDLLDNSEQELRPYTGVQRRSDSYYSNMNRY